LIDLENTRATQAGPGSPAGRATQAKFDRLLRPRSIALVGASTTPGSLGDSVLQNLEASSYAGDLYLVNPKRPVIRGRESLGSIEELPQGIDCAVLAIPGAAVLAAARACAKRGVSSLVVFSAGFAEGGEEGQAAQRELAQIAVDNGMVLVGPNCLGMVNYVDRIPLTFVVTPPQPALDTPGAAILSQSGALAAVIAVNMRHHRIPLTFSISTGNEAASGVEDFLDHFLAENTTRVFALVVEQFRQPRRFLELARKARAQGKFIVLLHPGKSQAARESAATHTGALAGDYEVMHALVTHAGVLHVDSLEELVDVTQILVRSRELPTAGPAIFTESGAFKALALDLCERVSLTLPPLSTAAHSALRDALPAFIPPSNPLDLTAQGLVDPGLYRRTLPAVLEDEAFGSVLLAIILTDPSTTAIKLPPILDAIRALHPRKPMIFAALDEGAPFDFAELDQLRDLGVACFPSPERAIRALAHVTRLESNGRAQSDQQPPAARALDLHPGILPEYKSKQLLANCGIPVPEGRLATTVAEALSIAREIGFPVALKAQAAALPHKSDAGGVLLGLQSEDAVVKAWSVLHANLERLRPGLALDGVLVEHMGASGLELIVGARNDKQWGPVLLVGFGGVLAEAIGDVRILPADLPPPAIVAALYELRCGKLLRGFRGSPESDVPAVVDVLVRIGQLVRGNPEIAEVEINPLVVYPKGQGVLALDALVLIT
jgi:acyl-CoA synthetase (NDP forming)